MHRAPTTWKRRRIRILGIQETIAEPKHSRGSAIVLSSLFKFTKLS